MPGLPQLVMLDRDGTVNVSAPPAEYITAPDQLELLPGAGQAVARLTAAGLRVALVTNQRGIARGIMTASDVAAVNDRLAELLAAFGGRIDAVEVCPHGYDECDCRKPAPGMLLRLLERFGVDAGDAVMIGDAASDVEAGRRAGVATVQLTAEDSAADLRVPDLGAAVDAILRDDLET